MKEESMKTRWLVFLVVLGAALSVASLSRAQNVKITPIGAVTGEFCSGDRALLFEDPTGVRVLIAPGRTVGLVSGGSAVGSADPRIAPLGSVHVVLIDHPHVDHLGDVRHTNCAGTTNVPFAAPGNTEGNASEIAALHKSAVLVGGELPDFFTQKLNNSSASFAALTAAQKNCPAAGLDNTFAVPSSSRTVNNACVGVIRGGTRTAVFTAQTTGVKITTIPAFHAAGASRAHVDELNSADPQGGTAVADPGVPVGLTGYAGHETGYILRFTNGLSVLWTGDSGLIGDWQTQAKFYKVNLAVVHAGDLFTMGPDEGAFAVRELIGPTTAIPEHFNQVSTSGGAVVAGTRLERFINQVAASAPGKSGGHGHKIDVVVPLSDQTFQFDGSGNCVAGPGC
jgi:L-ascorbate metabolism protein UlaG (beta-lactamase superfamily)